MLLIIYAINNESDIHYYVITKPPEQNSISMNINLTGQTGTEYGISVFALENGLPFSRVITSPKIVILATRSHQGLYIHVHNLVYIDSEMMISLITQRKHQL